MEKLSAEATTSLFLPKPIAPDAQCDLTPEEMGTLPFPCHEPGQNYGIMSVVAPPGWGTKRTSNVLAFRVYALYDTRKEADDAMKRADRMGYKFFDMFVFDVREGFIPIPPDPTAYEGKIPCYYDNPILEEIMRGHRDKINESSERLLARVNETPPSKGFKSAKAIYDQMEKDRKEKPDEKKEPAASGVCDECP